MPRKLWELRETRLALLMLAGSLLLFALWARDVNLSTNSHSGSEVHSSSSASRRTVVVRGQMPTPSATTVVHLSLPSIAYQVDQVVQAGSDGQFSLQLNLDSTQTELLFDIEVSQGEVRRKVLSGQTLPREANELVVPPLELDSTATSPHDALTANSSLPLQVFRREAMAASTASREAQEELVRARLPKR